MADAEGYEELAEALDALSHPVRVALLDALQSPQIQTEIEITHAPDEAEHSRPLARQSVRFHLGKLLDQGLVQEGPTERSFGSTTQYIADHQSVFSIAEQIRELSRLAPDDCQTNSTEPVPDTDDVRVEPGPRLLLVKGAPEGHVFELEPLQQDAWVIGRERDADVALDYDPYVSKQNARLTWDGEGFEVVDLPESRNGTRVNLDAIPSGEAQELGHGDVIGVGCSRLVFQRPARSSLP